MTKVSVILTDEQTKLLKDVCEMTGLTIDDIMQVIAYEGINSMCRIYLDGTTATTTDADEGNPISDDDLLAKYAFLGDELNVDNLRLLNAITKCPELMRELGYAL